jgi:hypothetical protein
MSRNVLIYSHVALWGVHHAQTVEIALDHLEQKDTVYVLSCRGDLGSCPANAFHDESRCKHCKKQSTHTIDTILGGRVRSIELTLDDGRVDLNLAPPVSVESMKAFTVDEVPIGELVLSQLVSDARDCFLDFADEKLSARALSLCRNAVALYEFSRDVIRRNAIDVVYAWNGRRCSDGPVLYAARREGKPFYAYISGGRKNTYLTVPALKFHDLSCNKLLIESLYLEAMSKLSHDEFAKMAAEFFNIYRHGGGDYPGSVFFGSVFKEYTDSDLPPKKKKRLVIFTSSYWEYFAMGDWLTGEYPYASSNFYEGINEILSDQRITANYEVITRWHPNLVNAGASERREVQKIIEGHKDVLQFPPDHTINSYALLESADIVITFGSTLGIEAVYYGRPSILLGPAMYEDTGSCYRPKTHEELVTLLKSDLSPLDKLGALKFGYSQRYGAGREFKHLRLDENGNYLYGSQPVTLTTFRARLSRFIRQVGFLRFCYGQVRRIRDAFAVRLAE